MLRTRFLGIELEKFGFALPDVLAEISNHIPRKQAWVILSINLHAISLMPKDKELRTLYRNADRIRFDGIGAIWLARLSGIKCVERIGADFLMKALYEMGQRKDWSFYLLGGPEVAAERAAERIKDQFPNISIVGTHHGYFDAEEDQDIIEEINELSPDILAVGLGMPYQEKWIYRNKERLKVGVITNCGGYIEQTANKGIDYYPDWTYKYKLNWFYRILKEPHRLWKRYLFEGITFLPFLFKEIFAYLLARFPGFNGKKHERET